MLSKLETISFKADGISPLILHNGMLSDPLYSFTKAIKEVSGKRHKVEADFEEMARLEFLGGLYTYGFNGTQRVVIPGRLLKAAIAGRGGAARREKMGQKAGVGVMPAHVYKLNYEGADDPNELWEDETKRFRVGVRVGQATVMRTRPIFELPWSFEGEIEYNPDFVDRDMVERWLRVAGHEVGIGDWRPSKGGIYGRFTVRIE